MFIEKKSLPEGIDIPLTKIKKALEKELSKEDDFWIILKLKHKDTVYRIELKITDYYHKRGRKWSITKIGYLYGENLDCYQNLK